MRAHNLALFIHSRSRWLPISLLAFTLSALGILPSSAGNTLPPLPPPPPDFNFAPHVLITSPASGERFLPGTAIKVQISSKDIDGYVPVMELFVDGVLVDSESRQFLTPPPPGQTHVFQLSWTAAREGRFKLSARATDDQGLKSDLHSVEIIVGAPAPIPTITVQAIVAEAFENAPNRPGRFRVYRSGDTSDKLEVAYNLDGVAQNGIDYEKLSGAASFPPGAASVEILVVPIPDKALEGRELVQLTLLPSPIPAIFPPPAPAYLVGNPRVAQIFILEDSAPRPIVTITATDSEAREGTPNNLGNFRVRRTGSLRAKLNVHYLISGSAENGVDYAKLPGVVSFPVGADTANISVKPLADTLAEPTETVVLKLVPSLLEIFPLPVEEDYDVGSPSQATVNITDRPPPNIAPKVAFISPIDGATHPAGSSIDVKIESADADGKVEKVALFIDNKKVAEESAPALNFSWKPAEARKYQLRAEAADDRGGVGKSQISIVINNPLASSFVKRQLPADYTPGLKLGVTLAARPLAEVQAYTVSDRPPRGWIPSNISASGVYDPSTRSVKFGPFFDNQPRALTYEVLPPANESGREEFNGFASANGVDSPISGDSRIDSINTRHPADNRPDDRAISAQELTAYSFAWKTGKEWSPGPNPIPQNYVTRAAFIWQSGEAYLFDVTQGPAPLWWTPKAAPKPDPAIPSVIIAKTAAPKKSPENQASRDVSFSPPNGPIKVHLTVLPQSGVGAYTVEEQIPPGWTISEINHQGMFDPNRRVIRWGLFLDDQKRVLEYQLTGAAPTLHPRALQGAASFDGVLVAINGRPRRPDSPPGRLRALRHLPNGHCELFLTVEPGQRYRLQTSTDLMNWSDLTSLSSDTGESQAVDPEAALFPARYYRLVPIE